MEESFENYFENSLQYFCGNTAVLWRKYWSTSMEIPQYSGKKE